jgi:hypothetical protein
MDKSCRINFFGNQWSIDEYNDQRAALAYAEHFFYCKLNALDKRILIGVGPVISTTDHWKAQKIYAMMEERDGHVEDADVLAIFDGDRPAYINNLLSRLVDQYGSLINRCLECNRVLRTWSAVRCPWCKASWPRDNEAISQRRPEW